METVKQITIKHSTYYFYNDNINLDEFDESKMKVDKKDFNDIDIYYLGYEHKKKISECNVINSVNPHYLRIVEMKGQFEKGKDDAWYLMNFSYGPYLCDGCYNIMQKCNKFKNIAIVHVKKSVYRIYFLYISKREAKKLMANSNLVDKKSVF